MDLIEILCLARVNRGTGIIEKPIQIYMKAGSMQKWVDGGKNEVLGRINLYKVIIFPSF